MFGGKQLRRGLLTIAAALTLFQAGLVGGQPRAVVQAAAKPASAPTKLVAARAAIMVDATSGQVIYQQNSDQKLPVASTSKLLTACVIEDEVAHHQLSWQQKVKISKAVAAISNNMNYSVIGLRAGQSYTVRELYDAMLVKSADGAALALATANGDSLACFNQKMKQKAAAIGIKDATIVNSVGLRNGDLMSLKQKGISSRAENAMSARDLAKLSTYIVRHYPQVLTVTKRPREQFMIAPGTVLVGDNLNQMLPGKAYALPNVTIDGLKTGTSHAAGACFVSSGTYQGRRIVTVVLHANDRFAQTKKLYHYLADNCQLRTLSLRQSQTRLRAANGTKRYLAAGPRRVTVWQDKQQPSARLKVRYRSTIYNRQHRLKTPVQRGQRLGTVTVKGGGVQTLDRRPLTIPLKSQETLKRGNFWQRLAN